MQTATPAEQLYTAGQSMQIAGQAKCISHLRANMDTDNQGFFKTWKGYRQNLNTRNLGKIFCE